MAFGLEDGAKYQVLEGLHAHAWHNGEIVDVRVSMFDGDSSERALLMNHRSSGARRRRAAVIAGLGVLRGKVPELKEVFGPYPQRKKIGGPCKGLERAWLFALNSGVGYDAAWRLLVQTDDDPTRESFEPADGYVSDVVALGRDLSSCVGTVGDKDIIRS